MRTRLTIVVGCFVIWGAVFCITNVVQAICVESGGGGQLTSGRMDKDTFIDFLSNLIDYANKGEKNIQFFRVQKTDGYYGKICNEEGQKRHFKEQFGIISKTPKCNTFCMSLNDFGNAYYMKSGIWTYEYVSKCSTCSNSSGCVKVRVCEY